LGYHPEAPCPRLRPHLCAEGQSEVLSRNRAPVPGNQLIASSDEQAIAAFTLMGPKEVGQWTKDIWVAGRVAAYCALED
jgi:hypothetical protein